jgi:predicted lipoprotein with Yx(FWY)xxD motif
VTWHDLRSGNYDIYAQRINASGTVQWTANGVPLCTATGPQQNPQIASDGSGGAIVTWTDSRSGNYDIYAQRISASGAVQWTANGVPLCTATANQNTPQIASDGSSGAIVTWYDYRSGNSDIYAQRIDVSGTVQWTANGVPLCTATGDQLYSQIASDGSGGALVTWDDQRSGEHRIYIQRTTDVGMGPVCEIYPEAIVIPDVIRTGTYIDTSFTITNIGLGMLVGYVEESCGDFEIVSGGGSYGLTNGQSRVVTVRFQPDEAGAHNCAVETGMYLCSDVSVTGTAYACPPDSVLYVDASAIGGNDGTSWADAFTDLQDALYRAGLCGEVTEIWVAGGTYYPSKTGSKTASFALRSGLAIYGGFAGTETSLGERDLSANTTVLSGDLGTPGYKPDNSYHVVTGSGANGTAVLDGFTITGGNAVVSPTSGGGMYSVGGSPTVRNVVFTGNAAGTLGGGMYNRSGSNPTVVNVVFFRNNAGQYGGGMCNSASSPVLINTTFTRNRAAIGGGGMYNNPSASPQIVNTIMWEDSTSSMVLPEIANLNSSAPSISYSLLSDCGGSGPGWESAYGTDGGHNTEGDADFVDMISGDLHLLGGSYAIDSGNGAVPGLPATDIEGNPRIQGTAVDMGAYEGEYSVVRVGVETDPPGLDIVIDGENLTSPQEFYARSGSTHEIGTTTPQTQGEILYSFAGWSDAGAISHEIAVPDVADTTYTATFTWAHTCALIDSIVDVPGDQGGWARVFFRRSHYDDVSETTYPIARYDMHRRVDDPALAARVFAEGKALENGNVEYDGRHFVIVPLSPASGAGSGAGADRAPAAAPPGLWEVVGTVSAAQQEHYICLAPTLADSAAAIRYTAYYISAHSTTPAVYFDSPADSGYSVDNIAPGAPLGLAVAYNTGSGNELVWDASPEPDFQYYRIYRGDEEDFVPGPATLVHQTATPGWTDPEYDGWDVHYKITALDHAGNESVPASPSSVTGADSPAVPKAFALYQNAPNPFNPTTTIGFDLERPAHVKLTVYNVKGEAVATLLNAQMTAGRKEISWTARDDRGMSVASGIYFYRLEAGPFTKTRKMVLLR